MAGKFSSDAAAKHAGGSPFELSTRRAGFPRSVRLLHTRDFARVYREGTRRSSPHFFVLARPNGLERSRFGISVKAALGNAVVRNRIKRRVREIVRQARPRLLAGWDVVVQPREAGVARGNFAALAAELTELVSAVGRV